MEANIKKEKRKKEKQSGQIEWKKEDSICSVRKFFNGVVVLLLYDYTVEILCYKRL